MTRPQGEPAGMNPPEYDPALVEAAVLAAACGHARATDLARERNPLYEMVDADAREAAFAACHARWFLALGLGAPLETALAETPAVARACGRCVVAPARQARDECAELFVPPEGGARPVVVIRVAAETLAAPPRALVLFRGELLHVADMLDPGFGYRPHLPAEDVPAPFERAVRERYRVLWDASVDGRLARAGRGAPGSEPRRRREGLRAFPELGDRFAEAFDAVWSGAVHTHPGLLALAAGGSPGAAAPRCPLCRFPSALVGPADLPPLVRVAIAADFPAWDPDTGACARCAELYAARGAAR
jgi:hypothetical protein